MTWTGWLITVPTVCYAAASAVYAVNRNWPLAITYFGYSFANCGLLMLDRAMAR